MKTLIITDIHGCLNELKALLALAEFDETKDFLICLGDLTDRGPDSYGVYMCMRGLKERMGDRCVILMGNHDDMLIHFYDDPTILYRWMRNRGGLTLDSFALNKCNILEHQSWFAALPLYYENESFICTHAGLVHRRLADNTPHDLFWDRELAYGNRPYHGKLLFYGHTDMGHVLYRDAEMVEHILEPGTIYPLPEKGSICLDTGCVYGGMLSGALIQNGTLQILQIPGENEAFQPS